MRKWIVLAALLAAFLCLNAVSASAEKTVKITFTGDCTIGSEELKRGLPTSFDSVAAEKGYGYFFENFAEMFAKDDATIINFEGVLQDYRSNENTRKTYRFRGPSEFTQIVTSVSIEAACMANNHVADYGNLGLERTMNALETAGVVPFRLTKPYILEKDGIRVAFFALDASTFSNSSAKVRDEIARLKSAGEANAVVLVYHGGNEYDPKHNANQTLVMERMISAGVDLVIMHHPHIVQGVALYNNRYTCFSLGNFVFGGNSEIREEWYRNTHMVSSLYALVVQAELHFDDNGAYIGQQLFLYPAFISGDYPHNDFHPRLVSGEDALAVFAHVQFDSAFQIPEFDEKLGCVVLPYVGVNDTVVLPTPKPTPKPSANPRPTANPNAPRTTRRPTPTPKPTEKPVTATTTPPADNPPADNPPVDNPPADNPPADNPPADNPPADNPPADNPPADNPPADNPPADNPPADNPPADNPPADNPPADNPPADNPPADNPPADNPPPEKSPADDPPAGGDE